MKPWKHELIGVALAFAVLGAAYVAYNAYWFYRAVINTLLVHDQRITAIEKKGGGKDATSKP